MQKGAVKSFRWTETLLGLAGLFLLVWMCRTIGFSNILEQLSNLGAWDTLFLIALYGLFQLSFCAAWHVLLTGRSGAGFWDLFLAYTAGDAINMTVPSANLAGEPVKVMLLNGKVPTETAVCSVTVYKFSDVVSLTVFMAVGWLAQWLTNPMPLLWNVSAGIVILGMAVLCIILYYVQNRGLYGPVARWLARMGMGRWVEKIGSTQLVDRQVSGFYREYPARFAASLAFNFLAWFGGVLEIMLFTRMSGQPCGFSAALTIETFSMFINNVAFFVPGRLGVGEGGRVLFFVSLGYPAAMGLSYGIVRRVRELAWIAAGVAILLFRRQKVTVPETLRKV